MIPGSWKDDLRGDLVIGDRVMNFTGTRSGTVTGYCDPGAWPDVFVRMDSTGRIGCYHRAELRKGKK